MWFSQKPIIALAPMADMTDQPFCRICREIGGKDFVIFREMVSAEAIVRGNEKTLRMCEFEELERPVVLQLFGSSPENITKAAKMVVEKYHPDGIDVNMGCPVPKITGKNLAGAALMKNTELAVEIIEKLKVANLGVPISVKTRLGWNKDNEILQFASALEVAGLDAISIHGRTKTQGYSGEANWQPIAEVKKLLKIPVLANGDIRNMDDVEKCLALTKADGVMIGRAALGNPWIFRQFTANSSQPIVNLAELKKMVLRHAELHQKHYGAEYGLTTFRKHLLGYFKGERVKGLKDIKKLKTSLVKVSSLAELERILKFL